MNRRDFAKGLAVLPFARLALGQAVEPACSNGTTCNAVPNSVLVWLEGPFAVVFNRNASKKIVDVTAFSPFDPDHLMQITSPKKTPIPPAGFPNEYHFTLKGVVAADTICVSPDFAPFCVNQLGAMTGNPDHSFVRLKLPRPKNVYTFRRRNGTANGKPVCIPQDHIFEYQTVSGQAISLIDEDRGTAVSLSPKDVLRLEVGLPRTAGDPNGTHATHFHNRSILPYFPGLQSNQDLQITDVQDFCANGKVPKEIKELLPDTTTTFECKTGGIIGGSP